MTLWKDHPDWDFERLRREGFSEQIVQAVDHVTRRDDETYEAFIERSAQNPLARRVKLVDLEDNMDMTRYKRVDQQGSGSAGAISPGLA